MRFFVKLLQNLMKHVTKEERHDLKAVALRAYYYNTHSKNTLRVEKNEANVCYSFCFLGATVSPTGNITFETQFCHLGVSYGAAFCCLMQLKHCLEAVSLLEE